MNKLISTLHGIMNKFIILEQIYKSYKVDGIDTEILRDASLTIGEGEFVIIMGPSGCGKTTLLNLIGALDTAYNGKIWVDGQILTDMSVEELTSYRREKIGFIFQFFNLLPTLTVEENVRAGIEILPISRAEVAQRTMDFLDRMHMANKVRKFPSQLSGGEQQRVAIARALAKNPRLLLADEPTGNLDEENGEKIMNLLKGINQDAGVTIVLVTHNVAFRKYADRIIEIHNKKILYPLQIPG
jgi:putative ABC transport system ATP-binding protein